MLVKHKTFIKYSIFYVLFFLAAFSVLFYVININLSNSIESALNEQINTNMDSVTKSLSNDFVELSYIKAQLDEEINLGRVNYKYSNYLSVHMFQTIKSQIASNSLLSEIIYVDPQSRGVYSGSYLASYDDGTVSVLDTGLNTLELSYEKIVESNNSVIKAEDNNGNESLIYIPQSSTYITLFILDSSEFAKLFDSEIVPTVASIEIKSGDNPLYSYDFIDTNPEAVLNELLFVCDYPDLQIIVSTSNEIMGEVILEALTLPYIMLAIVFFIGTLCFFLLMRNTYAPLKAFSKKVFDNPTDIGGYSDPLDFEHIYSAIDGIKTENALLATKIHDYRDKIQKEVFGELCFTDEELLSEADIDKMFSDNTKKIFVVYFIFKEEIYDTLKDEVKMHLAQNNCEVFVIERDINVAIMLVLAGDKNIDDKVKLEAVFDCMGKNLDFEYFCSNDSNSIINFARLYEEALRYSLPKASPKSDFDNVEIKRYPYQLIDNIKKALSEDRENDCTRYINEIFAQLKEMSYPDFFVQAVYLDIITQLLDKFIAKNFSFTKYSKIYYKTINTCRNRQCEIEKAHEAIINFWYLYQKLNQASLLTLINVTEYIGDNYSNESFSISDICEEYQVSSSYFSMWFRKETGKKFVDYVWEIRFVKVLELMENKDLSIKEIAVMVGYQNYTSFSRKFIDFTDQSPTQYRLNNFSMEF